MIHKDDIQWRLIKSLNLKNQHHTLLRDNELGVQMETITNKTNGGYGCGKAKSFFFIDNDEREFLTVDDMVDAYNERFRFNDENPHQEVEFIRVVKKKGEKVMVSIKTIEDTGDERSVATGVDSSNSAD